MKKVNIFIMLFLISCSSDYSEPVDLDSDYWEGEKLVILAEFNVGEKAEIIIQNTFSPVQNQLPTPMFLIDKEVIIMQDSEIYEKLSYDLEYQRYKSTKIISGGFDYSIVIPLKDDTIFSKTIHIPNETIKVLSFLSSVKDTVISGEAKINFQNFRDGNAIARIRFLGSGLVMNFKNNSGRTNFHPACMNFANVDLECLGDSLLNIQTSVTYFNDRYNISKSDSLNLFVQYISPELENLKLSNAYDGNEFGVNNGFVSSFSNAYGIFGYKHTHEITIPIVE